MSPRVYERKFDWDDARWRAAAGESITEIARSFGVSRTAVLRVVDPDVNRRMAERVYLHKRNSRCPDCGAQTWRRPDGREARCVNCSSRLRATSVRPDSLRCYACREWKPDEAFPFSRNNLARRGRHNQCRPCLTEAKRDYRRRNPGRG